LFIEYCRQRVAPDIYKTFLLHDIPLPVFRSALKKQFSDNSHLTDIRVIDRKIAECREMFVDLLQSPCFASTFKRLFLVTRKQHLYFKRRQQTSVDLSDVKTFAKLSSEWAKEDGAFKALHSLNRLRLPLIVNTVGKKAQKAHESLLGLRIADVGSGGGILTFPLVRLGADVDAIDASNEVIASAKDAENCLREEKNGSGKATFHCSSIENFAAKNAGRFDAVIASEILEHVVDLELFVKSCVHLLHNSGTLFFTTINKTVLSRLVTIWIAEDVLNIVPSGVHDWSKFVEPQFLQMILEENNCCVRLVHGMLYNPFANRWSWCQNTAMNYALVATKNQQ
uniref:Ubiquinone biosynthesis O-methyltransferase, mitochondrial n=1 Tax=Thelazia callipaeda TaxID=103827 RepID=A0A0N5D2Z1_THECL